MADRIKVLRRITGMDYVIEVFPNPENYVPPAEISYNVGRYGADWDIRYVDPQDLGLYMPDASEEEWSRVYGVYDSNVYDLVQEAKDTVYEQIDRVFDRFLRR